MNTQGPRGYQEGLLVDTLDRMRRNPEGRKVVHLRLSQLMPHNRTPVRIRILHRMFRNLESGRQVQLFPIGNDDLVIIVNAGAQRDVANTCERVRTLFESDPVTHLIEGRPDKFIFWFDLGLDAALAIHAAQQLRQIVQKMPPRSDQLMPGLTPVILDDVQKNWPLPISFRLSVTKWPYGLMPKPMPQPSSFMNFSSLSQTFKRLSRPTLIC